MSQARYHHLSNHRKFLAYATLPHHQCIQFKLSMLSKVTMLKGTQVKLVNRHDQ